MDGLFRLPFRYCRLSLNYIAYETDLAYCHKDVDNFTTFFPPTARPICSVFDRGLNAVELPNRTAGTARLETGRGRSGAQGRTGRRIRGGGARIRALGADCAGASAPGLSIEIGRGFNQGRAYPRGARKNRRRSNNRPRSRFSRAQTSASGGNRRRRRVAATSDTVVKPSGKNTSSRSRIACGNLLDARADGTDLGEPHERGEKSH